MPDPVGRDDPTLEVPAVSGAIPETELIALLRALGVAPSELARAEEDGTLVMLAIDRLALGQELRHDLRAAGELTDLGEDELRAIWRSLGFPEPAPGEPVFSDTDVRNLAAVADLMKAGVVTPEMALGMTRVVGSSMARIANALIDAVGARAQEVDDDDAIGHTALRSGGFLPIFPEILEQVWRRHLQAAARRRLLRGDPDDHHNQVVGFADLVGFTKLAQRASEDELSGVIAQFESLAYDVVVAGGGRVVKMIGDEVMFIVEDPVAGAEVALGLAEAASESVGLSEVRVGLAYGQVVERDGDAFGPTVNLASRITDIANPASVVVSRELRDALADHPEFSFRNIRPRSLKNIGRVSLAVLRRAEDRPSTIREAIDERRRAMLELVRDIVPLGGDDADGAEDPAEPERDQT